MFIFGRGFLFLKLNEMKPKLIAVILTIFLYPLGFALFFLDRICLVVLFWLDSVNMAKWAKKTENIANSLIRVFFIGIIYAVYRLIKYIFFT